LRIEDKIRIRIDALIDRQRLPKLAEAGELKGDLQMNTTQTERE
jgi:hypothetical protein